MANILTLRDEPYNDDYDLDEDIPRSHRLNSFVGVRNSQELIADQLDKGFLNMAKHALGDLFVGPIYVRSVFAFLTAFVFGCISCFRNFPRCQEDFVDMCIICVIYGWWFVFCAPSLLASINVRMVLHTTPVLFKVFFAEAAVMFYAYRRGHNNVLRRGFSLLPALEANRPGKGLAWLGEAGYNLRLSALIACSLIAAFTTCVEIWADR